MKPNSFSALAEALTLMSREGNNQKSYSDRKLINFWSNLSQEDQQKAFLIIAGKLMDSFEDNQSFREIIYNEFGFDSDIYQSAVKTGLPEFIEYMQETNLEERIGNVNRVELIDENGRAYVNMAVAKTEFSLQDNNQTLKIFVSTE